MLLYELFKMFLVKRVNIGICKCFIFQPAAALTTTAVQCLLNAALVEESVIMTATVREDMAVALAIVKTFIPLYQRKVHVVLVSKPLLLNDPDNLGFKTLLMENNLIFWSLVNLVLHNLIISGL